MNPQEELHAGDITEASAGLPLLELRQSVDRKGGIGEDEPGQSKD